MPLPAPEAQRRHRAFPRHRPRGIEEGGDLAELGLQASQPSEAVSRPALASPAVTSPSSGAVPTTGRPAPGPRAQPPRPAGTPLLLPCFSSASSVSQGKTAASFWAPHPRLGNPLSSRRHPLPGVSAPASPAWIWVCASGARSISSPKASRGREGG